MTSEIKNNPIFEKSTVVLVDVLGTTTSLNFAKDTLFPFVIKNAEEVLKAKWDEDSVKIAVKQLKDDPEEKEIIDLEAAVKHIKELTDSNSENIGLKTIQGIIYEKGYESGDLKAHVFPDVPVSFESWAKSRKIAVYSTGSLEAQKQLFSNTIDGDLSSHITKFFDQSVGPKTEADSYKKIAEELSLKPEQILFISDLLEEVKAAKSAGLSVAIVKRDGNKEIDAEDSKDFTVINSFKEISFENAAKRKNAEENVVNEEPPKKLPKTEKKEVKKGKDLGIIAEDEPMEVDGKNGECKKEAMEIIVETENKPSSSSSSASNGEKCTNGVTESKTEQAAEKESVKSTNENEKNQKDENDSKGAECSAEENKTEKPESISEEVKSKSVEEEKKASESSELPKIVEETSKEVVEEEQAAKPVEEDTKDSKSAQETAVESSEESKTVEESATAAVVVEPPKVDEEKENNKDLANGSENGEKEAIVDTIKATNGDLTDENPKVNGDSKMCEESNGKEHETEEIKVKSATASTETPTSVNVEV